MDELAFGDAVANAVPTSEPEPSTMLTLPAGNPVSSMASTIIAVDTGVSEDGLITIVLPAANAGAIPAAMVSIA